MRSRHGHGFVATEFVLGSVALLLPAVLLVGSIPTWMDRRVAAEVAARDAARIAATAWPAPSGVGVAAVVARAASDHHLPSGALRAVVTPQPGRGGRVVVVVTATMPGVRIPALGRIGGWHWSAVASERVSRFAGR